MSMLKLTSNINSWNTVATMDCTFWFTHSLSCSCYDDYWSCSPVLNITIYTKPLFIAHSILDYDLVLNSFLFCFNFLPCSVCLLIPFHSIKFFDCIFASWFAVVSLSFLLEAFAYNGSHLSYLTCVQLHS